MQQIDFSQPAQEYKAPIATPLSESKDDPVPRTRRKWPRWPRSLKTRPRLRRLVVGTLICVLLLAAAIGGWLGYRSDSAAERFTSDDDTANADGVIIIGQLLTVDLNASVATIIWHLRAVGNYTTPSLRLLDDYDYGYPAVDMDIYADGSATPAYRYVAGISGYNPEQTFTTRIRIQAESLNATSHAAIPSTVQYPLDTYSMVTTFGVRDSDNASVPVFEANLFGNLQGWETRTKDTLQVYVGANGLAYSQGRRLVIHLSRATAMVAFAIIIEVIMWMITLAMVYLTTLATVFARNVTPQLIAVPATVLFALPTIRNVMPGAPAFGTYLDICGLLMNEVIVAICFVSLVCTHLARTPFTKWKPISFPTDKTTV